MQVEFSVELKNKFQIHGAFIRTFIVTATHRRSAGCIMISFCTCGENCRERYAARSAHQRQVRKNKKPYDTPAFGHQRRAGVSFISAFLIRCITQRELRAHRSSRPAELVLKVDRRGVPGIFPGKQVRAAHGNQLHLLLKKFLRE